MKNQHNVEAAGGERLARGERPRGPAGREERAGWAKRESERRIAEENPTVVHQLVPLEELPNRTGWLRKADGTDSTPRGAGEASSSLENLVHGRCNGWKRKPTATEAEQVMKSRIRGMREDSIASTVITESSWWMILEAEAEDAYSLQDVGWWIRELEIPCHRLIGRLNALSEAWLADRTATRR